MKLGTYGNVECLIVKTLKAYFLVTVKGGINIYLVTVKGMFSYRTIYLGH